MKQAHQGRGITIEHFNLVVGHLKDSLVAAGVPAGTVTEILDMIALLPTAYLTVWRAES